MRPARRFPFGREPARPRAETAPLPERITVPLVESDAPPKPALPFRVAPILPPPVLPEAQPRTATVPAPSRARRWLRLAFIVLGLLAYAAVLLGIVAPESWWR